MDDRDSRLPTLRNTKNNCCLEYLAFYMILPTDLGCREVSGGHFGHYPTALLIIHCWSNTRPSRTKSRPTALNSHSSNIIGRVLQSVFHPYCLLSLLIRALAATGSGCGLVLSRHLIRSTEPKLVRTNFPTRPGSRVVIEAGHDTTNMPKEESLPSRKKMRKGTHSCFECMFSRYSTSISLSTISSIIYSQSRSTIPTRHLNVHFHTDIFYS